MPSSLKRRDEKEVHYLETSLRAKSKHFTPLPHARTFMVRGELFIGVFFFFKQSHGALQPSLRKQVWLRVSQSQKGNGINARILLNSTGCQLMFSVNGNFGLDLGSCLGIFFVSSTHCLHRQINVILMLLNNV